MFRSFAGSVSRASGAIVVFVAALALTACNQNADRDGEAQLELTESAFGKQDKDGYVLIDGTCKAGPPVTDYDEYHNVLEAEPNSLGFVRIRSSASFDAADLSNVMGIVPCGTIFRANGGVKNKSLGNAAGYYVLVRDSEGNRCRGYVSLTVVKHVYE